MGFQHEALVRRRWRRWAVAVCAAVALIPGMGLAASAVATPAAQTPGASSPNATRPDLSDILVPAQGALLGHFYGAGTISATDARIGRMPAIDLNYFNWADDWATASTTVADFAAGRIPLVNWEPFGVNFNDIISGKLDATIQARADGAKALGKSFFLDFAAEMNESEGWGGHHPAIYIAAWRHIHDIFIARGATNVVWAWCPNVTDTPGAPSTMSYYPGDAYVDWTGVDGYNWGTSVPGYGWQSFYGVFANVYPKLAAVGKPIIIGEMASAETGGSKAQWIADMVPTLKTKFPLVKAFVWFDINKERDWRINSSPASLAAYRQMAQDPYLNPPGSTTNDFSIAASPSSGSVSAGGSVTSTISTAVTAGSAQSVALSAAGVPGGVTVSFSPGSVTSGGSSTMTVSTSGSTAPGSYPVTVTGTAASGTHTATFTLTVTGVGGSTVYEAEAPSSVLAGGATIVACTACSGGARVGYLGGTGTLKMTRIAAATAGSYTITIAYTNGDTTSLPIKLSVNGGTKVTFTGAPTADWDTPANATITLNLAAGNNAILFSNTSTTGDVPDIDEITVPANHN